MNKPKAHSKPKTKSVPRHASQDVPARVEEGRAMPHILAIADALYPVREAVQAYAASAFVGEPASRPQRHARGG